MKEVIISRKLCTLECLDLIEFKKNYLVPFAIEERTGIIAVVDDLSKYTRVTYEFEAYVTDSRHTLTTNVTIHIVEPHETASASEGEGSLTGTSAGQRREPIELRVYNFYFKLC
jgi:hypothetical protein